MADDVDAPHEERFELPAGGTFMQVADVLASSSYLPMPSDAWGWTIKVGEDVVAVRPGFFGHRVVVLQGDPAVATLRGVIHLTALYVRPGSR